MTQSCYWQSRLPIRPNTATTQLATCTAAPRFSDAHTLADDENELTAAEPAMAPHAAAAGSGAPLAIAAGAEASTTAAAAASGNGTAAAVSFAAAVSAARG